MKAWPIVGALVAILIFAAFAAWSVWTSLEGVELGFHGTLALVLGVAATFGVAAGLMALVFYSARRGYDDIEER